MKKKKIISIILLLIAVFLGIIYYSWLENKNRNIQNMIAPRVPFPKVLYATVESSNFDHKAFKSKADITIINPSSVDYKNINVAITGYDKKGAITHTEEVLFDHIAPYTKHKKLISFPSRVRRITCFITKFE